MSPVGLAELLAALPRATDPDLLVGFETGDDAAVYRLDDERALVLTADFITPPVDDPYVFGQVAAANALSDVYAMGGRPVICLNLVGFPSARLDAAVLHRIVAGALSKITEAGAVLAGGHTTDDEEPKFGLSVVGMVHPAKVWRNVGARPGDALVLTKPLGSGVLFNANRRGKVSPAALDACLASVTTLNRAAAEVLAGFTVHAATDVTGFGLAGHALGMAVASSVTMTVDLDALPVFREALDAYRRGVTTGVNRANRDRLAAHGRFAAGVPRWREEIAFDPQTSGGLLVALPAAEASDAVARLHAAGVADAGLVGDVTPFDGSHHLVFAGGLPTGRGAESR